MGALLEEAIRLKDDAESRGDAGKFEALEMIVHKLSRSGGSDAEEVSTLRRLEKDLLQKMKEFEDYVTSDHAKARSQYKADLEIVRILLNES